MKKKCLMAYFIFSGPAESADGGRREGCSLVLSYRRGAHWLHGNVVRGERGFLRYKSGMCARGEDGTFSQSTGEHHRNPHADTHSEAMSEVGSS